MRLSADSEDPGYAWWSGRPVKVLFNGVEARGVVTADEEKGMIVRFVTDDNGRFKLAPCKAEVLTEVLYGDVRIEISEGFTAP